LISIGSKFRDFTLSKAVVIFIKLLIMN